MREEYSALRQKSVFAEVELPGAVEIVISHNSGWCL
jgi:hypothetical protein